MMEEITLSTVSGPIENVSTNKTLGQYLIDCIKERQSNEIIYIDAVTERVLTCGELLENIVKAIHVFKDLGLKKDDVIAIISENDIKYNVPIIAGFCMGITAQLLNPSYSLGELRHALAVAKPKLVICSVTPHEHVQTLRKEFDFIKAVLLMGINSEVTSDTSLVHLDNLVNKVGTVDCAGFRPPSFDVSKQGALIISSSGTTGLPKGAFITHENFTYTLSYIGDPHWCGLNADDRMIALLPAFLMYGIMMMLSSTFLKSKTVVLQKFNLGLYLKTIEKYRVNKLHLVPTVLQIFANEEAVNAHDLSSVEDILVSGAPLFSDDVAVVGKRLPNVNVREVYGATEYSGACTFLTKFPKKANCVGTLIPNMECKVCDASSGASLRCMEVGELCFKGPMVMQNYVGIPNDKSIIDDDGFYHSGDLGYYDEEGYLYVVDRIKNIIKYKGFQVSPLEIERILLLHPNIEDCAVIGIPDKRAGQLPLAFVVPKLNCTVTAQEVVEFVRERISIHKQLHGGVRFVEKLPKSSTGKILRKLLVELL